MKSNKCAMYAGVAPALALFAWAAPASADFCMLTQNGLRLGHGAAAYQQAKRDGFRQLFQDYDVVVLQEVMDADEAARLTPPGFRASVSIARGSGGYREHYAVLTRDAAVRVLAAADYPDDDGAFARPPFGVAIADKDGGRFWLVDFHAVFGRGGVAPRRAEAAAMAAVIAHFAARPLADGSTIERVVVAGDWNLPATDAGFAALAAASPGTAVAPEIRTSLNADGRFVSAYDHFVWNRARMAVEFAAEPRDTGGLAPAQFRAALSDHAGVAGYVLAAPDGKKPAEVACPPVRTWMGS